MAKDTIKLDPRNYRKHGEKNKQIIKKSLEDLGAGRSVLIDRDGVLIAGNGVYEQAKRLRIPVRVIETDGRELVAVKRTDLATDDEKRKRLALVDNAATDTSEWATDLLKEDWTAETLSEFGVALPDEKTADDFGTEFSLNDKPRDGFRKISFQISEKQAQLLEYALSAVVYSDAFAEMDKDGNENENGCAVTLFASLWLENIKANIEDLETKSEEAEAEISNLRKYLRDALSASGKAAKDVDRLLGTSGMSGHYFGESQWAFPTRQAYEKMRAIMELPKPYEECALIVRRCNFILNLSKKINNYGQSERN